MKRQRSSESMASISPNSSDDKNQEKNPGDDDGCSAEESCQASEKKTRLSIDQVRALERSFEAENKLDPRRKVKLALEVGLQPRQVAIWFQNRRARYKSKQLESDYRCLKANFDGLRTGFELLQRDNESLLQEVRELKSRLNESSSKQGKIEEQIKLQPPKNVIDDKGKEFANKVDSAKFNVPVINTIDGSSKIGLNTIFNEGNDNNNNSYDCNQNNNVSYKSVSFHYQENSVLRDDCEVYLHHPFLKIEFDEELIFVGDQTPTLQWYME